MQVGDAKRLLKGVVEKQVPVSLLFVGPMGCGKSEIVAQVAEEKHIGLVDLRLAQMEPGDLIGIPYKRCTTDCKSIQDKDGNVQIIHSDETTWAKPFWFPKEGTKGILFLDELNRAPNDVRQTVFQLIWDRRMHGHVLPDGWTVASAINPDSSDYQVETLDKAMIRRFCVLAVEPNWNDWDNWARSDGKVSSDITGFIGTHKNMLFEPENVTVEIKRNPAAWSLVNTFFNSGAVPSDLEFEVLCGMVGKEAAVSFIKYKEENYLKPVSGEAVLKDYSSVRERVLAQRKKNDEMSVTIAEIVKFTEVAKKLSKKQQTNLVEFLLDLPADFQVLLMSRLPSEVVSTLAEEDKRVLVVGRVSKQARGDKKDE